MKKLGGDFWMQNKKKNEVPSDIDIELSQISMKPGEFHSKLNIFIFIIRY